MRRLYLSALLLPLFGCSDEAVSENPETRLYEHPTVTRVAESDPELRTFPGYEAPEFSHYDKLISDEVANWNSVFSQYSDLPGYERLDPNLFKSLVLSESAGSREYYQNPAKLVNVALAAMRDGTETSLPEGGYPELHDVLSSSQLTPELSIRYGILWLWHQNSFSDIIVEIDLDQPWIDYTIQSGDSLDSIAIKYGSTADVIVDTNDIENPDLIHPGVTISFPKTKDVDVVTRFLGWERALQRYNGEATQREYASTILGRLNPIPAGQILVRSGDTLSDIALSAGMTIEELMRLNNIENEDEIVAGQILRVE